MVVHSTVHSLSSYCTCLSFCLTPLTLSPFLIVLPLTSFVPFLSLHLPFQSLFTLDLSQSCSDCSRGSAVADLPLQVSALMLLKD